MIENLLNAVEQEISENASGWTAVTNCSVSSSTVLYRVPPASLLLTPTTVGGADMVVDLARSVTVEAGRTYRVFCSARNDVAGTEFGVQPRLFNAVGTELDAGLNRVSATTAFNRWVLAVSEFTVPANAITAKVRLDSEAVTGGTWFDVIGFVAWDNTPDNGFLRLMLRTLPEYMLETDALLTSPDRPLTRFVDLVAASADDILTAVLAFDYISPVDGVVGYDRSTLVQPEYYPTRNVAEPAWLPWLAQIVGVRPVFPMGSGSLTPWYRLEASYPTWNDWQDIDSATNPAFPVVSLSRNGTTGVVTAVYGAQSAGSSYTPTVGDPVEVTGTTGFNGAFVLLSVNTGTSTLTWSDPGATASAGAAGTITYSDTSWSEIEGFDPSEFDSLAALRHLIRTAATGVRAGSAAAVVNAARAVLDGPEFRATASRSSNVVTVTTDAPHTFDAGDYVRLCESAVLSLNIVGTVASVVDGNTFTVASTGLDTDDATVYATSREVELTNTGTWTWDLDTLASQTYSSDLLQAVVGQAKPAGVLITFGNI